MNDTVTGQPVQHLFSKLEVKKMKKSSISCTSQMYPKTAMLVQIFITYMEQGKTCSE